MQALSMGLLGVKWRPGEMLLGAAQGHTPWPEWAIRMPVFILTLLGLYLLYKGVARVFGRRTGMVGAIILATMPQWFLLAHQSITDMPLVACLSASMGLLILGMHTGDDDLVPAYEVTVLGRKLRLSAYHLVFVTILAAALPQILYLLSRNIELLWAPGQRGFRLHLDEFRSGSGLGNCGLPGNEACVLQKPVNKDPQPCVQALIWLGALGVLLWLNWGERRRQRLCFLAAWFFAAVATLGKGPAGILLPALVAFTYVAATRKWSKLLTLEAVSGLLILGAVALPWYVSMYVRHGGQFSDRLIFHDMYKRMMTHVHDTNEGDDVSFRFFIWQLGYALFPWTGLVPAGLVWWARRRDDASGGKGDVSVFLAMWFVFAFGLFTAMLTKFHHYIFPAVPPAAMLTGIVVDRMLGAGSIAKPGRTAVYLLGLGTGAALMFVGAVLLFPGWITGYRPDTGLPSSHPLYLSLPFIVVGIAAAIACALFFGRSPVPDAGANTARDRHESLMLGGSGLAAAIVVALAGRDMTWKTEPGDIAGQARLIYLFTYNYRRQWPETLEFTGTIAACTIIAVAILVLLVVERWRRHLMVLFTAMSLLWAAWGVDVYLVKASPHWGQREILEAYMKYRESSDDPIVAYQMNWKGENFYTGNRLPAFVSTGATFVNWVKSEVQKGHKTIFYVTEHSRTSGLRNEAQNPKVFDLMTDKRTNNKFVLVRARYDSVSP
jgi:4-amino-4-deoxy-L-arabinose transferase-like glycosyltransferase